MFHYERGGIGDASENKKGHHQDPSGQGEEDENQTLQIQAFIPMTTTVHDSNMLANPMMKLRMVKWRRKPPRRFVFYTKF